MQNKLWLFFCLIFDAAVLNSAQALETQRIDNLLFNLLDHSENDDSIPEIRELLQENVSPFGLTEDGETALTLAIKQDNPQIAKLLIETIEQKYGIEKLRSYLKSGEINEDEFSGHTALAMAAEKGDIETLKLILAKDKSTLEQSIAAGDTPLMLAALHNNFEAARILLSAGAQMNAQDHKGSTALIYAAANDNPSMVSLLLEHGADYTMQDDQNLTAADHAVGAARKLLENYIAKSETARGQQPEIKTAVSAHILPDLANIVTAYLPPHPQEERELVEAELKATSQA